MGPGLTFGLDVDAAVLESDGLADRFLEHKLLVARGLDLDTPAQERISRRIGPVPDPATYISNVDDSGYHPEVRLLFHSDFAFTAHPVRGISLYCIEAGPGAAATSFVDGVAAARTLPPELRARVAGRSVVHLADTELRREDVRRRLVDVGGAEASTSTYPRYTRPALWPHPSTGAEVLYVLEQQASHVEGVDEEASEALLADLFAHLYAPEHTYVHHWEPGDLVLWDNLALQHGRPENPRSVRRHLRRTVISDRSLVEIIAGMGFPQP